MTAVPCHALWARAFIFASSISHLFSILIENTHSVNNTFNANKLRTCTAHIYTQPTQLRLRFADFLRLCFRLYNTPRWHMMELERSISQHNCHFHRNKFFWLCYLGQFDKRKSFCCRVSARTVAHESILFEYSSIHTHRYRAGCGWWTVSVTYHRHGKIPAIYCTFDIYKESNGMRCQREQLTLTEKKNREREREGKKIVHFTDKCADCARFFFCCSCARKSKNI